jgi:hypothetical protein
MEVFVITENVSYDDDIETFHIIGVWPTFKEAMDKLVEKKCQQDEYNRKIEQLETDGIIYINPTKKVRWEYRDFEAYYCYEIESVEFHGDLAKENAELQNEVERLKAKLRDFGCEL